MSQRPLAFQENREESEALLSEPRIRLADWVTRVEPSATTALEAAVRQLQHEGRTVYRLGLGQPDFPTPECAKSAAIEAIQANFTEYTDVGGILPLRGAIAAALQRDLGLHYDPSDIVVSVGGKHALFNAICTLIRTGDEVLIPTPYWVSFPQQVKFAGGVPVFVPTTSQYGYKVTPETLLPWTTSATRVLILNNPNNPSGAVYSAEELGELAEFCRQRDIWVISDEVYSSYVYTTDGYRSIASYPGMRERTVVVNSVSKTYSMTGWRIGYSAAPQPVTQAMLRLQSHTTSNPSSIAQRAALAAIESPQTEFMSIREEYQARRDFLIERVRELCGLECLVPDGAFYVWVDVSSWIGRTLAGRTIETADDLAGIMLSEAGVAVMPGTGFGSPSHLRFSYAVSRIELERGMIALENLLGKKTSVY